MTDHIRDLTNTQESVDVFGDHPDDPLYQRLTSDRRVLTTGFYTRMFIEDAQYVVTFPRWDSGWEASLAGNVDDATRQLVIDSLPSGYADLYGTLTEAYRDFSAACVQNVVTSGRAVYEVVYYLPDGQDSAEGDTTAWDRPDSNRLEREEPTPIAFRLVPVRPYVRGPGGGHFQYVPALETEEVILGKAEPQPPRWIELDPDRLVVFSLPPARARQVARALNGLALASRFHGHPSKMFTSGDAPGYDVEVHQRTAHETLARVTRDVGWNVRMLFQERQLEPYQLHRQLRFVRFKIELRDMVTRALNQALAKAGRRMGFTAKLELPGVPTVEDVDAALRELQEGPRGKLVALYERFHPL